MRGLFDFVNLKVHKIANFEVFCDVIVILVF